MFGLHGNAFNKIDSLRQTSYGLIRGLGACSDTLTNFKNPDGISIVINILRMTKKC